MFADLRVSFYVSQGVHSNFETLDATLEYS
jgi:hypothetical protein